MSESLTLSIRKRPGRPKRLAKTGGRRKGTPNKATTVRRAYIVKYGQPIRVLCQIAAGQKMKVGDPDNPGEQINARPTYEQRLRAAAVLASIVAAGEV